MRAISLVKRIEFEFSGNVVRNALTLGDVDNDGRNELVVGNQNGEVSVFKGLEKFQTIHLPSSIGCVAVGDITNENKNTLTIITGDGWCYLYAYPKNNVLVPKENLEDQEKIEQGNDQPSTPTSKFAPNDFAKIGSSSGKKVKEKEKNHLRCIHMQRIPTNTKSILLGDIDGDGSVEMVLGLTDRVVRSYRWIPNSSKSTNIDMNYTFDMENSFGKFIAVNKWECANQIGSITLHHYDGKAALLIAQPGGTFMRIKCQSDDSVFQETGESSENEHSSSSIGENMPGCVDYQFLGISRMRNQNISTEILGDLQTNSTDSCDRHTSSSQKSDSSKNSFKGRPYAVATLDGTIMLVRDEIILWAFAVDHQTFALTKLDVTGNGADDIVVCSWDGQTYILDQEKNSVRFHLDEPVQAFESGYYNVKENEPDVTCFVYITFKNTVKIYYDIPLKELTCKKFEPDFTMLSDMFLDDHKPEEARELIDNLPRKNKKELLEFLLYNVHL